MPIAEFAKLAGISVNHAYYLAANNALPVEVIRLGRRMVLPRKRVLALLDGEDIGDIDTDRPGSVKS